MTSANSEKDKYLIVSSPLVGVRPVVDQEAAVVQKYAQIKRLCRGSSAYLLFAEPVFNRMGKKVVVSWYTELSDDATEYEKLSDSQRRTLEDALRHQHEQLMAQGDTLPEKERAIFDKTLAGAQEIPDKRFMYLVGEHAVLTHWGFVSDELEPQRGIVLQIVKERPRYLMRFKAVDELGNRGKFRDIQLQYKDELEEEKTDYEGVVLLEDVPVQTRVKVSVDIGGGARFEAEHQCAKEQLEYLIEVPGDAFTPRHPMRFRVVDAEDYPGQDLVLRCRVRPPVDQKAAGDTEVVLTTDADGRVELPTVVEGALVTVTVLFRDGTEHTPPPFVCDGDQEEYQIIVPQSLRPESALRFNLIDPTGNPVTDVGVKLAYQDKTVSFRPADNGAVMCGGIPVGIEARLSVSRRGKSVATGTYTCEVDSPVHDVIIEPEPVPEPPPPPLEDEIAPEPTHADMAFRFVDPQGKPVPNIEVSVRQGDVSEMVRADPRGNFVRHAVPLGAPVHLAVLRKGKPVVEASRVCEFDSSVQKIVVPFPKKAVWPKLLKWLVPAALLLLALVLLLLWLYRDRELTVEVRDRHTGEKISGATVEIDHAGRKRNETTKSSGRVAFGKLSWRELVALRVQKSGYASQDKKVKCCLDGKLVIQLVKLKTLKISVVDELTSTPVAGARVILSPKERSGTASDRGRLTFSGVPNKSQLTLTAKAQGFHSRKKMITCCSSETVEIKLKDVTKDLRVAVKDQYTKQPIANAKVTVKFGPGDSRIVRRKSTNAGGMAVLGKIPVGRELLICAEAGKYAPNCAPSMRHPGTTQTIYLDKNLADLKVKVITANPERGCVPVPVSNAEVDLKAVSGNIKTGRTDRDGIAVFRNVGRRSKLALAAKFPGYLVGMMDLDHHPGRGKTVLLPLVPLIRGRSDVKVRFHLQSRQNVDVDLHLQCRGCGKEVYYGNKSASCEGTRIHLPYDETGGGRVEACGDIIRNQKYFQEQTHLYERPLRILRCQLKVRLYSRGSVRSDIPVVLTVIDNADSTSPLLQRFMYTFSASENRGSERVLDCTIPARSNPQARVQCTQVSR